MTKRLTAWKLTSPWLRVPKGATRVRMIFTGRWKIQVPRETLDVPAEEVKSDERDAGGA